MSFGYRPSLAQNQLLGRFSPGAGPVEAIDLGTNLQLTGSNIEAALELGGIFDNPLNTLYAGIVRPEATGSYGTDVTWRWLTISAHTDTGLSAATTYYYRIKATAASGTIQCGWEPAQATTP